MTITIYSHQLNDNSYIYKLFEDDYMKLNKITNRWYFEYDDIIDMLTVEQLEAFAGGAHVFEIADDKACKYMDKGK